MKLHPFYSFEHDRRGFSLEKRRIFEGFDDNPNLFEDRESDERLAQLDEKKITSDQVFDLLLQALIEDPSLSSDPLYGGARSHNGSGVEYFNSESVDSSYQEILGKLFGKVESGKEISISLVETAFEQIADTDKPTATRILEDISKKATQYAKYLPESDPSRDAYIWLSMLGDIPGGDKLDENDLERERRELRAEIERKGKARKPELKPLGSDDSFQGMVGAIRKRRGLAREKYEELQTFIADKGYFVEGNDRNKEDFTALALARLEFGLTLLGEPLSAEEFEEGLSLLDSIATEAEYLDLDFGPTADEKTGRWILDTAKAQAEYYRNAFVKVEFDNFVYFKGGIKQSELPSFAESIQSERNQETVEALEKQATVNATEKLKALKTPKEKKEFTPNMYLARQEYQFGRISGSFTKDKLVIDGVEQSIELGKTYKLTRTYTPHGKKSETTQEVGFSLVSFNPHPAVPGKFLVKFEIGEKTTTKVIDSEDATISNIELAGPINRTIPPVGHTEGQPVELDIDQLNKEILAVQKGKVSITEETGSGPGVDPNSLPQAVASIPDWVDARTSIRGGDGGHLIALKDSFTAIEDKFDTDELVDAAAIALAQLAFRISDEAYKQALKKDSYADFRNNMEIALDFYDKLKLYQAKPFDDVIAPRVRADHDLLALMIEQSDLAMVTRVQLTELDKVGVEREESIDINVAGNGRLSRKIDGFLDEINAEREKPKRRSQLADYQNPDGSITLYAFDGDTFNDHFIDLEEAPEDRPIVIALATDPEDIEDFEDEDGAVDESGGDLDINDGIDEDDLDDEDLEGADLAAFDILDPTPEERQLFEALLTSLESDPFEFNAENLPLFAATRLTASGSIAGGYSGSLIRIYYLKKLDLLDADFPLGDAAAAIKNKTDELAKKVEDAFGALSNEDRDRVTKDLAPMASILVKDKVKFASKDWYEFENAYFGRSTDKITGFDKRFQDEKLTMIKGWYYNETGGTEQLSEDPVVTEQKDVIAQLKEVTENLTLIQIAELKDFRTDTILTLISGKDGKERARLKDTRKLSGRSLLLANEVKDAENVAIRAVRPVISQNRDIIDEIAVRIKKLADRDINLAEFTDVSGFTSLDAAKREELRVDLERRFEREAATDPALAEQMKDLWNKNIKEWLEKEVFPVGVVTSYLQALLVEGNPNASLQNLPTSDRDLFTQMLRSTIDTLVDPEDYPIITIAKVKAELFNATAAIIRIPEVMPDTVKNTYAQTVSKLQELERTFVAQSIYTAYGSNTLRTNATPQEYADSVIPRLAGNGIAKVDGMSNELTWDMDYSDPSTWQGPFKEAYEQFTSEALENIRSKYLTGTTFKQELIEAGAPETLDKFISYKISEALSISTVSDFSELRRFRGAPYDKASFNTEGEAISPAEKLYQELLDKFDSLKEEVARNTEAQARRQEQQDRREALAELPNEAEAAAIAALDANIKISHDDLFAKVNAKVEPNIIAGVEETEDAYKRVLGVAIEKKTDALTESTSDTYLRSKASFAEVTTDYNLESYVSQEKQTDEAPYLGRLREKYGDIARSFALAKLDELPTHLQEGGKYGKLDSQVFSHSKIADRGSWLDKSGGTTNKYYKAAPFLKDFYLAEIGLEKYGEKLTTGTKRDVLNKTDSFLKPGSTDSASETLLTTTLFDFAMTHPNFEQEVKGIDAETLKEWMIEDLKDISESEPAAKHFEGYKILGWIGKVKYEPDLDPAWPRDEVERDARFKAVEERIASLINPDRFREALEKPEAMPVSSGLLMTATKALITAEPTLNYEQLKEGLKVYFEGRPDTQDKSLAISDKPGDEITYLDTDGSEQTVNRYDRFRMVALTALKEKFVHFKGAYQDGTLEVPKYRITVDNDGDGIADGLEESWSEVVKHYGIKSFAYASFQLSESVGGKKRVKEDDEIEATIATLTAEAVDFLAGEYVTQSLNSHDMNNVEFRAEFVAMDDSTDLSVRYLDRVLFEKIQDEKQYTTYYLNIDSPLYRGKDIGIEDLDGAIDPLTESIDRIYHYAGRPEVVNDMWLSDVGVNFSDFGNVEAAVAQFQKWISKELKNAGVAAIDIPPYKISQLRRSDRAAISAKISKEELEAFWNKIGERLQLAAVDELNGTFTASVETAAIHNPWENNEIPLPPNDIFNKEVLEGSERVPGVQGIVRANPGITKADLFTELKKYYAKNDFNILHSPAYTLIIDKAVQVKREALAISITNYTSWEKVEQDFVFIDYLPELREYGDETVRERLIGFATQWASENPRGSLEDFGTAMQSNEELKNVYPYSKFVLGTIKGHILRVKGELADTEKAKVRTPNRERREAEREQIDIDFKIAEFDRFTGNIPGGYTKNAIDKHYKGLLELSIQVASQATQKRADEFAKTEPKDIVGTSEERAPHFKFNRREYDAASFFKKYMEESTDSPLIFKRTRGYDKLSRVLRDDLKGRLNSNEVLQKVDVALLVAKKDEVVKDKIGENPAKLRKTFREWVYTEEKGDDPTYDFEIEFFLNWVENKLNTGELSNLEPETKKEIEKTVRASWMTELEKEVDAKLTEKKRIMDLSDGKMFEKNDIGDIVERDKMKELFAFTKFVKDTTGIVINNFTKKKLFQNETSTRRSGPSVVELYIKWAIDKHTEQNVELKHFSDSDKALLAVNLLGEGMDYTRYIKASDDIIIKETDAVIEGVARMFAQRLSDTDELSADLEEAKKVLEIRLRIRPLTKKYADNVAIIKLDSPTDKAAEKKADMYLTYLLEALVKPSSTGVNLLGSSDQHLRSFTKTEGKPPDEKEVADYDAFLKSVTKLIGKQHVNLKDFGASNRFKFQTRVTADDLETFFKEEWEKQRRKDNREISAPEKVEIIGAKTTERVSEDMEFFLDALGNAALLIADNAGRAPDDPARSKGGKYIEDVISSFRDSESGDFGHEAKARKLAYLYLIQNVLEQMTDAQVSTMGDPSNNGSFKRYLEHIKNELFAVDAESARRDFDNLYKEYRKESLIPDGVQRSPTESHLAGPLYAKFLGKRLIEGTKLERLFYERAGHGMAALDDTEMLDWLDPNPETMTSEECLNFINELVSRGTRVLGDNPTEQAQLEHAFEDYKVLTELWNVTEPQRFHTGPDEFNEISSGLDPIQENTALEIGSLFADAFLIDGKSNVKEFKEASDEGKLLILLRAYNEHLLERSGEIQKEYENEVADARSERQQAGQDEFGEEKSLAYAQICGIAGINTNENIPFRVDPVADPEALRPIERLQYYIKNYHNQTLIKRPNEEQFEIEEDLYSYILNTYNEEFSRVESKAVESSVETQLDKKWSRIVIKGPDAKKSSKGIPLANVLENSRYLSGTVQRYLTGTKETENPLRKNGAFYRYLKQEYVGPGRTKFKKNPERLLTLNAETLTTELHKKFDIPEAYIDKHYDVAERLQKFKQFMLGEKGNASAEEREKEAVLENSIDNIIDHELRVVGRELIEQYSVLLQEKSTTEKLIQDKEEQPLYIEYERITQLIEKREDALQELDDAQAELESLRDEKVQLLIEIGGNIPTDEQRERQVNLDRLIEGDLDFTGAKDARDYARDRIIRTEEAIEIASRAYEGIPDNLEKDSAGEALAAQRRDEIADRIATLNTRIDEIEGDAQATIIEIESGETDAFKLSGDMKSLKIQIETLQKIDEKLHVIEDPQLAENVRDILNGIGTSENYGRDFADLEMITRLQEADELIEKAEAKMEGRLEDGDGGADGEEALFRIDDPEDPNADHYDSDRYIELDEDDGLASTSGITLDTAGITIEDERTPDEEVQELYDTVSAFLETPIHESPLSTDLYEASHRIVESFMRDFDAANNAFAEDTLGAMFDVQALRTAAYLAEAFATGDIASIPEYIFDEMLTRTFEDPQAFRNLGRAQISLQTLRDDWLEKRSKETLEVTSDSLREILEVLHNANMEEIDPEIIVQWFDYIEDEDRFGSRGNAGAETLQYVLASFGFNVNENFLDEGYEYEASLTEEIIERVFEMMGFWHPVMNDDSNKEIFKSEMDRRIVITQPERQENDESNAAFESLKSAFLQAIMPNLSRRKDAAITSVDGKEALNFLTDEMTTKIPETQRVYQYLFYEVANVSETRRKRSTRKKPKKRLSRRETQIDQKRLETASDIKKQRIFQEQVMKDDVLAAVGDAPTEASTWLTSTEVDFSNYNRLSRSTFTRAFRQIRGEETITGKHGEEVYGTALDLLEASKKGDRETISFGDFVRYKFYPQTLYPAITSTEKAQERFFEEHDNLEAIQISLENNSRLLAQYKVLQDEIARLAYRRAKLTRERTAIKRKIKKPSDKLSDTDKARVSEINTELREIAKDIRGEQKKGRTLLKDNPELAKHLELARTVATQLSKREKLQGGEAVNQQEVYAYLLRELMGGSEPNSVQGTINDMNEYMTSAYQVLRVIDKVNLHIGVEKMAYSDDTDTRTRLKQITGHSLLDERYNQEFIRGERNKDYISPYELVELFDLVKTQEKIYKEFAKEYLALKADGKESLHEEWFKRWVKDSFLATMDEVLRMFPDAEWKAGERDRFTRDLRRLTAADIAPNFEILPKELRRILSRFEGKKGEIYEAAKKEWTKSEIREARLYGRVSASILANEGFEDPRNYKDNRFEVESGGVTVSLYSEAERLRAAGGPNPLEFKDLQDAVGPFKEDHLIHNHRLSAENYTLRSYESVFISKSTRDLFVKHIQKTAGVRAPHMIEAFRRNPDDIAKLMYAVLGKDKMRSSGFFKVAFEDIEVESVDGTSESATRFWMVLDMKESDIESFIENNTDFIKSVEFKTPTPREVCTTEGTTTWMRHAIRNSQMEYAVFDQTEIAAQRVREAEDRLDALVEYAFSVHEMSSRGKHTDRATRAELRDGDTEKYTSPFEMYTSGHASMQQYKLRGFQMVHVAEVDADSEQQRADAIEYASEVGEGFEVASMVSNGIRGISVMVQYPETWGAKFERLVDVDDLYHSRKAIEIILDLDQDEQDILGLSTDTSELSDVQYLERVQMLLTNNLEAADYEEISEHPLTEHLFKTNPRTGEKQFVLFHPDMPIREQRIKLLKAKHYDALGTLMQFGRVIEETVDISVARLEQVFSIFDMEAPVIGQLLRQQHAMFAERGIDLDADTLYENGKRWLEIIETDSFNGIELSEDMYNVGGKYVRFRELVQLPQSATDEQITARRIEVFNELQGLMEGGLNKLFEPLLVEQSRAFVDAEGKVGARTKAYADPADAERVLTDERLAELTNLYIDLQEVRNQQNQLEVASTYYWLVDQLAKEEKSVNKNQIRINDLQTRIRTQREKKDFATEIQAYDDLESQIQQVYERSGRVPDGRGGEAYALRALEQILVHDFGELLNIATFEMEEELAAQFYAGFNMNVDLNFQRANLGFNAGADLGKGWRANGLLVISGPTIDPEGNTPNWGGARVGGGISKQTTGLGPEGRGSLLISVNGSVGAGTSGIHAGASIRTEHKTRGKLGEHEVGGGAYVNASVGTGVNGVSTGSVFAGFMFFAGRVSPEERMEQYRDQLEIARKDLLEGQEDFIDHYVDNDPRFDEWNIPREIIKDGIKKATDEVILEHIIKAEAGKAAMPNSFEDFFQGIEIGIGVGIDPLALGGQVPLRLHIAAVFAFDGRVLVKRFADPEHIMDEASDAAIMAQLNDPSNPIIAGDMTLSSPTTIDDLSTISADKAREALALGEDAEGRFVYHVAGIGGDSIDRIDPENGQKGIRTKRILQKGAALETSTKEILENLSTQFTNYLEDYNERLLPAEIRFDRVKKDAADEELLDGKEDSYRAVMSLYNTPGFTEIHIDPQARKLMEVDSEGNISFDFSRGFPIITKEVFEFESENYGTQTLNIITIRFNRHLSRADIEAMEDEYLLITHMNEDIESKPLWKKPYHALTVDTRAIRRLEGRGSKAFDQKVAGLVGQLETADKLHQEFETRFGGTEFIDPKHERISKVEAEFLDIAVRNFIPDESRPKNSAEKLRRRLIEEYFTISIRMPTDEARGRVPLEDFQSDISPTQVEEMRQLIELIKEWYADYALAKGLPASQQELTSKQMQYFLGQMVFETFYNIHRGTYGEIGKADPYTMPESTPAQKRAKDRAIARYERALAALESKGGSAYFLGRGEVMNRAPGLSNPVIKTMQRYSAHLHGSAREMARGIAQNYFENNPHLMNDPAKKQEYIDNLTETLISDVEQTVHVQLSEKLGISLKKAKDMMDFLAFDYYKNGYNIQFVRDHYPHLDFSGRDRELRREFSKSSTRNAFYEIYTNIFEGGRADEVNDPNAAYLADLNASFASARHFPGKYYPYEVPDWYIAGGRAVESLSTRFGGLRKAFIDSVSNEPEELTAHEQYTIDRLSELLTSDVDFEKNFRSFFEDYLGYETEQIDQALTDLSTIDERRQLLRDEVTLKLLQFNTHGGTHTLAIRPGELERLLEEKFKEDRLHAARAQFEYLRPMPKLGTAGNEWAPTPTLHDPDNGYFYYDKGGVSIRNEAPSLREYTTAREKSQERYDNLTITLKDAKEYLSTPLGLKVIEWAGMFLTPDQAQDMFDLFEIVNKAEYSSLSDEPLENHPSFGPEHKEAFVEFVNMNRVLRQIEYFEAHPEEGRDSFYTMGLGPETNDKLGYEVHLRYIPVENVETGINDLTDAISATYSDTDFEANVTHLVKNVILAGNPDAESTLQTILSDPRAYLESQDGITSADVDRMFSGTSSLMEQSRKAVQYLALDNYTPFSLQERIDVVALSDSQDKVLSHIRDENEKQYFGQQETRMINGEPTPVIPIAFIFKESNPDQVIMVNVKGVSATATFLKCGNWSVLAKEMLTIFVQEQYETPIGGGGSAYNLESEGYRAESNAEYKKGRIGTSFGVRTKPAGQDPGVITPKPDDTDTDRADTTPSNSSIVLPGQGQIEEIADEHYKGSPAGVYVDNFEIDNGGAATPGEPHQGGYEQYKERKKKPKRRDDE